MKKLLLSIIFIISLVIAYNTHLLVKYPLSDLPETPLIDLGDLREQSIKGVDISVLGMNMPERSDLSDKIVDIIKEEAEGTGIKWQDLYVLAKYESSLNPYAEGTTNKEASFGLYQINTLVHDVTYKQAIDIRFSIQWTISNLIKHGYLEGYRTYSLARHQGDHKIPHVMQRARNIVWEANRIE